MSLKDKLSKKVQSVGKIVGTTLEIMGTDVRFSVPPFASESWWNKTIGTDTDIVETLFAAISEETHTIVGVYNSDYYLFLAKEMSKIIDIIVNEGCETRHAVIKFPDGHCFNTLQVLIRPDYKPKADGAFKYDIVIDVSMRSCNVDANFADDAYLSWLIGRAICYEVSLRLLDDTIFESPIFLCMHFGSLHKFIKVANGESNVL